MKKLHILFPLSVAMFLASCSLSNVNSLLNPSNGADGNSQNPTSQNASQEDGSQAQDASQGQESSKEEGSQGQEGSQGGSQGPTSGLTREEAMLVMADIGAHLKAESFALPSKFHTQARTTMASADAAPGEAGMAYETVLDYDGDAKKASYAYTMDYGAQGSDSAYGWLWGENGHYYMAQSPSLVEFTEASYEEIPAEEYPEAFASMTEEMIPSKNDLVSAIENIATTVAAFEQIDSNSGVIEQDGTTITYNFSKYEVSEKYFSYGAGSFVAEVTADIEGVATGEHEGTVIEEAANAQITLSAIFENYLPVHVETTQTVNASEGETTVNMILHSEETFEWNTCNFRAPDLSQFPEPSVEEDEWQNLGDLSFDEACEVMSDIHEHLTSEDFVVPNKFSSQHKNETIILDQEDVVTDGTMSEIVAQYDGELKKASITENLDVIGEDRVSSNNWIWAENDHFFMAQSPSLEDFSQGEYTELPAEEFEGIFSSLTADYLPTAYDLVEPMETLQAIRMALDMIYDGMSVTQEDCVLTYDVAKKTLSESYTSSADGDFLGYVQGEIECTITTTSLDGEPISETDVTIAMFCRVYYREYLPVMSELVEQVNGEVVDGEVHNVTVHEQDAYTWNDCAFYAPDLSRFPVQTSDDGGEGQVGGDGQVIGEGDASGGEVIGGDGSVGGRD